MLDTLIIDGREFFLMEHMEYGRNAAYVILDAEGKIVAEDNRNGFDERKAADQRVSAPAKACAEARGKAAA